MRCTCTYIHNFNDMYIHKHTYSNWQINANTWNYYARKFVIMCPLVPPSLLLAFYAFLALYSSERVPSSVCAAHRAARHLDVPDRHSNASGTFAPHQCPMRWGAVRLKCRRLPGWYDLMCHEQVKGVSFSQRLRTNHWWGDRAPMLGFQYRCPQGDRTVLEM